MPIIVKACTACKTVKNITDYYKDKSTITGYEYKCKICSVGKTRTRTRKNRVFIKNYKLEKGCIDCGYSTHHAALEFDHVRGVKFSNISAMARYSLDSIKKEIEKCEVRCSNCHHIKSYDDNVIKHNL